MSDDATQAGHLFVFTNEKAGMGEVDKDHVKKVVFELSKNSSFYKNEQRKAQRIDDKVMTLKRTMTDVNTQQIESLQHKYNRMVAQLEETRDTSRVWIHVDMDMFYAAVEMRDDPSLLGKPMAVGGISMISTANYEARKYGVRSAMPGFIARQLCPDLIFVSTHFDKYREAATQIRAIFDEYDPNFDALSLDEAALDVTSYTRSTYGDDADLILQGARIAEEIRTRIFEVTRLTASAGIACNRMLAKICSDMNKPNGQLALEADPERIQEFMDGLPTRKIPGIGKVMERILIEFGASNCGDILNTLPIVHERIMKPRTCEWLLQRCMGIAANEHETDVSARKSVSVERTFKPISDNFALQRKCREIARKLADDVAEKGVAGKTVTLKLKLTNFQVLSRSVTRERYIETYEDIVLAAMPLLVAEFPLSLRLMGLRLSSLNNEELEEGQPTLPQLFATKTPEGLHKDTSHCEEAKEELPSCPMCGTTLYGSNMEVNRHIDTCLSGKESTPDERPKKKGPLDAFFT